MLGNCAEVDAQIIGGVFFRQHSCKRIPLIAAGMFYRNLAFFFVIFLICRFGINFQHIRFIAPQRNTQLIGAVLDPQSVKHTPQNNICGNHISCFQADFAIHVSQEQYFHSPIQPGCE